MLAHTLGNPFDVDAVTAFCRAHGLWLVEDNCDANGSLWRGRRTGTFGDLSTLSFYPPHHMTTGEGGAVLACDARDDDGRGEHPRLGAGLLVRVGEGQHLREAVRLEARRPSRPATTTNTLTVIWATT